MPRAPRVILPCVTYHVLNRAIEGKELFSKAKDYEAFEGIIQEGLERLTSQNRGKLKIYAYCLMPNHWHFVMETDRKGLISDYIKWVCTTHGQRKRLHQELSGRGHVYQGRFKSFPVKNGEYFERVCRYVEANPLRAGLVDDARNWQWSSLGKRNTSKKGSDPFLVSDWPGRRPEDWDQQQAFRQFSGVDEMIRISIIRGRPLGDEKWTQEIAAKSNLTQTVRGKGRPPKNKRGLTPL